MKHTKILLFMLTLANCSYSNSATTTAQANITESIVTHYIKARMHWLRDFPSQQARGLIQDKDNNFASYPSVHFDARIEGHLIVISTDIWLDTDEFESGYQPLEHESNLLKYKLLKVIKSTLHKSNFQVIPLDENTRTSSYRIIPASNSYITIKTIITRGQFEYMCYKLMAKKEIEEDSNASVLRRAQKLSRESA